MWIYYRDVRPSNIYIQEDDTLALGDFGVDTIMGDTITCTRANAGIGVRLVPLDKDVSHLSISLCKLQYKLQNTVCGTVNLYNGQILEKQKLLWCIPWCDSTQS